MGSVENHWLRLSSLCIGVTRRSNHSCLALSAMLETFSYQNCEFVFTDITEALVVILVYVDILVPRYAVILAGDGS